MNAILVRSERFLDRPLGMGVRVALFLCALLLLPTRGIAPGAALWLPLRSALWPSSSSACASRGRSGISWTWRS